MRRVAVFALTVAVAVALSGCTGDAKAGVPTARSTPPTATATASPSGVLSQEIQFVGCMRQNGIADMPDPIPGDTSGRSSVRYALDVMGKGSDETFQAALDKCMKLLPQVDVTKPATSGQKQRDLEFAKCMRDHGVTDFPDDIPYAGNSPAILFYESPKDPRMLQVTDTSIGVNLGIPVVKAAFDACQANWLKLTS